MADSEAAAAPIERLKVFVSYSRTDLDFADQLVLALEDKGFEPLVDRHDIDAAEKWKDRLGALIAQCDTVVFVLSEKSAGSPICQWEVEEAARLNKRIIPVVSHDPAGVAPPPQLGELNYIHFFKHPSVPGSGFYAGVQKLERALKVNLGWLRRQTAYAEQAALWSTDKSDDRVLSGKPLEEALQWRAEAPRGATVAPLVLDYLTASEAVAARRKAEADANIAEREGALKRARRATMIGVAVAAGLMLIALAGNVFAGYFALRNSEGRSAQFAQQSLSLTAAADRPLAILLALEGDPAAQRGWLERMFHRDGFSPARNALITAVAHNREQRVFAVGSPVASIAFSPDGQHVLIGSDDGKVRLVAVSGGPTLATFEVDGEARSVAFSPDGRHVLVGSDDGKAQVFAASGGAALATFDVGDYDTFVAFSPDSQHALIISYGEARLFAASGGSALVTFDHMRGIYISSGAFSPDGQHVLLGSPMSSVALLFAVSGGPALAVFNMDGSSSVSSVAFAPDGRHVLIGCEDGRARLFAISREWVEATFDVGGVVRSVAFSPDGRHVLIGSDNGKAQLFAVSAPRTTEPFSPPVRSALATLDVRSPISSVAFSPDGQHVLIGSRDGVARLFAASSEPALVTLDAGVGMNSFVSSPDGRYVLTGSYDGAARLFAASGGPSLVAFDEGDLVSSVAISPDGQHVLVGYRNDSRARLFAASGGRALATFDQGSLVISVAFSPDGQHVLILSDDGKARLFAVSSGSALATFDEHFAASIAFSPDGQRVLIGSRDGAARLFAASGGRALVTFDVRSPVGFVAFSPDGQHVVTGSSDGSARLYAASGGSALSTFDEGSSSIAISPDGEHVLTGSSDGAARLFAASGGPALVTFDGGSPVTSVAFSPDGRHVLIGAFDGTVQVRPVPRIVLASAREQVRIGCEMLHDMGIVEYSSEDLQRFPILRGEPRWPCASVPPRRAR